MNRADVRDRQVTRLITRWEAAGSIEMSRTSDVPDIPGVVEAENRLVLKHFTDPEFRDGAESGIRT